MQFAVWGLGFRVQNFPQPSHQSLTPLPPPSKKNKRMKSTWSLLYNRVPLLLEGGPLLLKKRTQEGTIILRTDRTRLPPPHPRKP